MKFLLYLFRFLWKPLWYGFAAAVVLIAALFSIARLLLPMLGEYSASVENYFSRFVDQPIRIQSLDAEWRGWGPSLVLNNVLLLDKQGTNTIVRVAKANLGLGLWKTATTGQLGFSSAELQGVDLSITRLPDGQITLTGFELLKTMETEVADNTFLAWLLQQGRIGIQFRNLLYEDRMAGRKHLFNNVALSVMNDGDRHLIEGWIGVPKKPAQKVTVFVDAQGDLLRSDQWSGKLYVKGNGINVIDLLSSLIPLARQFTIGASDFEIWSTWHRSKLQRMQGMFAVQDLAIKNRAVELVEQTAQDTVIGYQQLAGRFLWEQRPAGWRLQADQVRIKNSDRQWPESHFQVNYRGGAAAAAEKSIELDAMGNFLRAQDLTPLLQLFELRENEVVKQLHASQAGFDMHDYLLRYSVNPGAEKPEPRLTLAADIKRLQTVPDKNIPGIKNLSGHIRIDGKTGYFLLDSRNTILDMPNLFRQQILLNELQGDLGWVVDDKAFSLTARNLRLLDGKFTLQGLLDMEMPLGNDPSRHGAPYVNFIARFANGEGNRAVRRIPAKIMGPSLVQWLDHAIVAGHVPSGNVVFHGNVADFPFRNGVGVFKVKFDIQNGVLDYGKGWPRLEDLQAEVEFNGPALTIKSNKGAILQSKISNTLVRIADLDSKPLKINIKGDVDGATQSKSDYILASPTLRRKFGKFFQDVQFSGDSTLRLDVDLHIKKGDVDADVNGSLRLAQNTIRYSWFGEALTQINGEIGIVPHGIKARAIKSSFYGQPTTIDIDTSVNQRTGLAENIQVSAISDMDSLELSKHYMPVASDLVGGRAKWNVMFFIPVDDRPNAITQSSQPIRFTAQSNLRDVELRLPAPLGKPSGRMLNATVEGMLYMDSNYLFRLNYGNRVNAVTEYRKSGAGEWRGEIRFGNGPVELPEGEGFRLVGHLQDVSADVWRSLISQAADSDEGVTMGKKPAQWPKFFQSADLTIDRLKLFGQEAKNMMLHMSGEERGMVFDVNSDELKGKIRIPFDMDRYPLVLDLDRWELTAPGEGEGAQGALDPREFPAVKAFAKSVSFQDRRFGSVKLETTKIVEGLRLEQLILQPRSTVISATGKWTKVGNEQKSDFQLHLDSQNLGETMDDLDYVGSISGGEGTLDMNVSWPGALTEADFGHLNGNVSIDFKNGKLLAIDSGAGRIFGLFSIQTLPKRLLLDFSDLYQKGVVFNQISGTFNIEKGDAYTDNFYLDGPAAKAQAAGRIGLDSRDYDQLLTFTPQSADIASYIGLLVSTPWGFVLPQIFKDDINRAMSFQYTLTGHWDDPHLEPVAKPQTAVFGE